MTFQTITVDRPLVLLGCGNMGQALLKGWLAGGLATDQLCIIDPALEAGLPTLGVPAARVAPVPPENLKAGIIMLAVKPQILERAASSLSKTVDHHTTVLSIMAGVDTARMDALLPGSAGIVRTMPNTPAAIGKGVTGLYAQNTVSDAARGACDALMQAAGRTVWVDKESDLNAVTAVSGSGPAYVFHLIEALAAAGVDQGLSAEVSETLAIETVFGAGALAATRVDTPEQLRIKVTSPGGTTQAGLDVLMREPHGLTRLIAETVEAARKRAEALA